MRRQEVHHFSKVTAKGQVTLPAELRQKSGIKPGDLVELRAGEGDEGVVIEVRRRPSMIEATAGIARPKVPYRPPRWDEVEEIVKEEVGDRLHREMKQ